MFGQQRPARAGPGRARIVDPGRVLRRRRSPLQFALGVLVVFILVVELLILQAYVNVKRSTAMFSQMTFLTGNLVNVQREPPARRPAPGRRGRARPGDLPAVAAPAHP